MHGPQLTGASGHGTLQARTLQWAAISSSVHGTLQARTLQWAAISSSGHGTLQARTPQWAAISSSRGSSRPRNRSRVSRGYCTAGGLFTAESRGSYCLSEEAVQIAQQRREAKGEGERERCAHLNAELQTTARREKKAFLNEQCKETEGNHRMAKTRHFFEKTGAIKGTFHARMSMKKHRNGKD